MGTSKLGRLESEDLREAWSHEAHDFTPWLAENLDRLSEAIGLDLDLEGCEVQVGPYRADIVANDPSDGTRVLIENQLKTRTSNILVKCWPIWPAWRRRWSSGSPRSSTSSTGPPSGG